MNIKPNEFTEYELADDELILGQSLSQEQVAVLQNDLASLSRQRANLVINPAKITESLIADANIKGRIEIIQLLLDRNNTIQQYQYNQNSQL